MSENNSLKVKFKISPPPKRRFAKNPFNLIMIILICVLCYSIFNMADNRNVYDLNGNAELHVIDVGQGDSLLILAPGGTVLIDAGPVSARDAVNLYLKNVGVEKIDCLFLTHPHEDHIGGAADVIENYEITTVYMPDHAANTRVFERLLDALEQSDAEVRKPSAGEVLELGDLKLTILAPLGDSYSDTNDYSIVIRADYGGVRFLLTGDATSKVEGELLAAYPAEELRCDLLKLGHHGSSTSTSARFLEAVQPSMAVICCGRENTYGHPTREIIERLKEYEIEIFRADISGNMVFVTDGNDIQTTNNTNFKKNP